MSAFDISFEEEILACGLRSDDFIKRAARVADAHHFATKYHSWIWKVLRDSWIKYKERPTARIFLERAKNDFKKVEDRKAYWDLYKKLRKTKPRAPRSALEQLSTFIRKVELQQAAEAIVDALTKDDLDAAGAAFNKGSRVGLREREYTHVRFIEEFDERQAQRKYQADHPEEFVVVPTGIGRLDKLLNGGVRIGELNLVMGTTGTGKSITMSNLAHVAVANDFPTVYLAFEMPARQVATRQDSRFHSLRYDQFKAYDFLPSDQRRMKRRMAKMAKRWENKFHILSWPVRSANINDIYAALEDLRVEFGFEPKVIMIDSGDHLKAIETLKEGFRLQQTEVYWAMKHLAEEGGYSVWSSVHAGREWATRTATAEASSESYDKSRISDLVISINDPNARKRKKTVTISEDDEDKEDDEAEIKGFGETPSGIRSLEAFVAKYRDGDSKIKIKLDADFARMKIVEHRDEDEDEEKKAEEAK